MISLSKYIADYVNEELDRGVSIDETTIDNAIKAHEGGAGEVEGHFYVVSIGGWECCDGKRLFSTMRRFEKDKLGYSVWWVPVPIETPYSIEQYRPMVKGAQLLNVVRIEEQIA